MNRITAFESSRDGDEKEPDEAEKNRQLNLMMMMIKVRVDDEDKQATQVDDGGTELRAVELTNA